MKIIELYGDEPIENVLGGLCLPASEIVYISTQKREVFDRLCLEPIKSYYRKKAISTPEISYVQVIKNDINDVLAKLHMLACDGEELAIDIIGGDDTLLCAAGIFYERNDNVTLYRIDPVSGYTRIKSKDGRSGAFIPRKVDLTATVEENIILHSGRVLPYSGSGAFVYDKEFVSDIDKMWRLCAHGPRGYVHKRSAPQTWNSFVLKAAGIEKLSKSKQAELLASKYKVRTYLEELKKLGMVSYRRNTDGSLSDFKYKNEQVRECILKAGNLLEQKVYLTCAKYLGRGVCDVKTGVGISWSPDRQGMISTENEIDVLVMRSHSPVFISCKNGKFESEELYKLSSVAQRFGGKYSKKLLVATDLAHTADAQTVAHLRARAEEMGIVIIENVQRMTDNELDKALSRAIFN